MAVISTPRPSRRLPPVLLQQYVQAYWSTGSHAEACKLTGRKHPPHSQSIAPYLQEISARALEDVKGRRGRIITELETIAYSRLTDYVEVTNGNVSIKDITADKSAAVESIKETRNGIEIKLYNKLTALETLAKITGLAVDRIDVTSGGRTIQPINMTFEVLPPPTRVRDTNMEITDGGKQADAVDRCDTPHTDRQS